MGTNITEDNLPQPPKGGKPTKSHKAVLESSVASEALASNGNGATLSEPSVASLKKALQGHTSSAATSAVGARPSIAELRAAMGAQPDLALIDRVAEQYECRDPKKEAEYFRANSDLALWQEAVMLVDQDGFDKANFLVSPGMQPPLQRWLKRRLLVPCVNADGEFFVWGITIADIMLGQRSSKVEQNKRAIAQQATMEWTAFVWHKGKHIGVPAAEGGVHLGEPAWPKDLTADLIIERTFLGNYIADPEHEMAKIYLGTAKR